MDYDVDFISSLLRTDKEGFREAVKRVPSLWIQGRDRHIYNWIKKYYLDTKGNIPSMTALRKEFSFFKITEPEDALIYYCGQLERREKYVRLTKGNTKIQNALLSQDVEMAENELQKLAGDIFQVQLAGSESVRQGLIERKKKYVQARQQKGVIGYTTAIEPFDKHIGGVQSEYTVLLGKYAVGKTFFLLMLGTKIWPQLKKPLVVVSLEMPKKSIEMRLDSVIGGFSHSKYRRGLLNKEEEKRLLGLKEIYARYPEIIVIPGAGKHLTEIEYEILSVEPGLVLYDGIYLTNMGYNDQFKDTLQASRGLQRICKKYEIPIIGTSQLKDEDLAKYSRALQEDSDIVIKQWRDAVMFTDKQMGFQLLKCREEMPELTWYMNWDFDAWNFSVVKNVALPKEEMKHE